MRKNSRGTSSHRLIAASVIETNPDERGNFFRVESDQLMNIRSISICLKSENKSRHIGTLYTKDRILKISRNRGRHLFKKNNSYGFNEHIIRTAILFDRIILTDEFGVFDIPKDLILEKGTYLDFKQNGFEKQIFLALEIIEQHRK